MLIRDTARSFRASLTVIPVIAAMALTPALSGCGASPSQAGTVAEGPAVVQANSNMEAFAKARKAPKKAPKPTRGGRR